MVGLGGLGASFAGMGFAVPELQKIQDEQNKKNAAATLFRVLQQNSMVRRPNPAEVAPALPGAQPMPSIPGGTNSPQGGPVPLNRPQAPEANLTPPSPMPTLGGVQPLQSGPAGGVPSLEKMIELLASSPGSDEVKMRALEEYGAFSSPFDKMQTQLQLKQQQLEAAAQRLQDQQNFMMQLTRMKEGFQGSEGEKNRNARGTQQTTTRDVGALEKELADQRALLSSMLNSNPKAIDSKDYKDAKAEYDSTKKELDAARKGGTVPSAAAPAPKTEAASGVGVPAELKDKPDGTTVQDTDGNTWIKKKNQLVPQG